MSQENVAIVKEFHSLFEAGNREAWRNHFHPDVVWDASASDLPMAGVYNGHEGIERFFTEWLGIWDDYEVEHREFVDAGDSVVVVFLQRGRGKLSGAAAEREFFGVYDLEAGKVRRYRAFESREEAMEEAGLTP
ncbi:MAG: nuclear transport factor 2 family protein [Solirubrobacterales bacterium]